MRNELQSPGAGSERILWWRDLASVIFVTIASGFVFAQVELNERVFDATRRWEHLQLDELPGVLVVLALCLTWFAWRRNRETRRELSRRRAAEARLANLLLENRRLAQEYLGVQELERKTLARELHDELGQYLNAIKTDAVSIQEKVATSAPALQRASGAIIEHTDHMHAIVRDLVRRLRPVGLDELGLRAALEHYLDSCQRRMPQLAFSVALEGDLDTLDERVSLAVYRLVQEGITNVARHSDAHRVEIKVQHTEPDTGRPAEIRFSMADDGRGAQPTENASGLGLIGMRERVEMLGGQLHVATGSAQGFSIAARIPLAGELAG